MATFTINSSTEPKNDILIFNNQYLYVKNNIGSKIIDNEHIDPANTNNVFAKNNQRPIFNNFNRPQSLVNNHAKSIRLTSTTSYIRQGFFNFYTGRFSSPIENIVYHLCPENNESVTYFVHKTITKSEQKTPCYQTIIDNEDPLVPIVFNSSISELEQNGIYLQYREKQNLSQNTWDIIYVPTGLFEIVNAVDGDGSPYTYLDIDYESVLPNGEYDIKYDIAKEIVDDNN